MLNSQQVPFKLRYVDVVLSLLRMIILTYNKLVEVMYYDSSHSSHKTLYNLLHKVDKLIIEKILSEICADLNASASRKSQLQLTKVFHCLSLNRLPNMRSPSGAASSS